MAHPLRAKSLHPIHARFGRGAGRELVGRPLNGERVVRRRGRAAHEWVAVAAGASLLGAFMLATIRLSDPRMLVEGDSPATEPTRLAFLQPFATSPQVAPAAEPVLAPRPAEDAADESAAGPAKSAIASTRADAPATAIAQPPTGRDVSPVAAPRMPEAPAQWPEPSARAQRAVALARARTAMPVAEPFALPRSATAQRAPGAAPGEQTRHARRPELLARRGRAHEAVGVAPLAAPGRATSLDAARPSRASGRAGVDRTRRVRATAHTPVAAIDPVGAPSLRAARREHGEARRAGGGGSAPAPDPGDPVALAQLGGAAPPALRGVSLDVLPACASKAREDRLKQRIIAAATSGSYCRSEDGHFYFLETKNLNAFLMMIEPGAHRSVEMLAEGDVCDELVRALRCLDPLATRRQARLEASRRAAGGFK